MKTWKLKSIAIYFAEFAIIIIAVVAVLQLNYPVSFSTISTGLTFASQLRSQENTLGVETASELAAQNVGEVFSNSTVNVNIVSDSSDLEKIDLGYFSPAKNNDYDVDVAGAADVIVATCKDCSLFPVDKTHALPPTYAPAVVDTNLAGGGKLTTETAVALKKLFNSARAKGLQPRINSAYRSYQTQLTTFNWWVSREINRGASKLEAEQSANRYSARPGHSEHQLGTTVDIGCNGCSGFDRTNPRNKAIWDFLETEAHKYGFVVSYPPNSEDITGYVYEPWHIRYVGVELATEIYEEDYFTDTSVYLAKFLRDEGQY